jgi:cell division transport system permease protein
MTNQRMTSRFRGNVQTYFARHAQTLVGSLGRMVNQPFATLMTMGVVAVALALPLFLNLFLTNARSATGNWNEAFDVSVYMDKRAGAARTATLAKQLRQRSDVAAVRVIAADQALAEFRHDSGFGKALDALIDNPLPDTLIVTPTLAASTPQGTDALKGAIAAIPDVHTVQVDTEWVKRLHGMLDILRRVVLLTAGLLGAGVVLIVGNTIRLDILNRRAMALTLVALAAVILAKPVESLAKLYGSQFRLQGLGFTTGVLVLALATSLAWLGSWLAATRHIRAIEPT